MNIPIPESDGARLHAGELSAGQLNEGTGWLDLGELSAGQLGIEATDRLALGELIAGQLDIEGTYRLIGLPLVRSAQLPTPRRRYRRLALG